MDLYVANIDKNDKIHGGTYMKQFDKRYFKEFKLFTRAFINLCKNNPNDPQNIHMPRW